MGQKQSGITNKNPFKLFEYQCSTCKSKRPIQYFYRDGTFLKQAPRVVCGGCRNSALVEPFKTVDYSCPSCKKWQKVRLPAKPVSLNMYNVTKASCTCGFRGEVAVGKVMDVACGQCWAHKREMRDVWTEDGDEVRTFCDNCQEYQRSFARSKGAKRENEMEYTCGGCSHVQPIGAEELLRNQGLVCCPASACGWVGYPEITQKGLITPGAAVKAKAPPRAASTASRGGAASASPQSVRRQASGSASSLVPRPSQGERSAVSLTSGERSAVSLTSVVPYSGDPN